MTTVEIEGIPVIFPFPPYDIQKTYMAKVIQCLQTGQNGVLESPTGTGKTLCLLCATLAWVTHKRNCIELDESGEDFSELISPPRIIYASRTHSQLQQAVQEMKRTAYNDMTACVLGSREQMCIDAEVISEPYSSFKIRLCQAKVKKKTCCYHGNVERQINNPDLSALKIVDIEDLVALGQKHVFCPYFMARELKADSDVIFMPYNYLLDPRMAKTIDFGGEPTIVIFDEAHNIEKTCEASVSVQLKATTINASVDDLGSIIEWLEGSGTDSEVFFTPTECLHLKHMLVTFGNTLNEIKLLQLSLQGTVFDGDFIYTMLEKAGITQPNHDGVIDLITQIIDLTTNERLPNVKCFGLQIFSDLLSIAFYKSTPEFRQRVKECFKVQIEEVQEDWNFSKSSFRQSQKSKCRALNFWCFSPAFAMKMLTDRNIHSIILTSGTLAPLKALISELELDVSVHLENPHIVKGDQVCVNILAKGPDQELLISNYHNRNNPNYLQSLGLVISNLIRVIPNGVLIFFPSYTSLEACCRKWQQSGIWNCINDNKKIFIEPKDKINFAQAMADYYRKIEDPNYKGAIFMGVCRGKISEGLDFANINGRAVFITGLPYPPLKDAKVILKKQYLDECNGRDREYLKGDEWYTLEATRAINQAIGRVIRHKDDYGAIILLDSRFSNPRIKNNMSLWLRHHIHETKNFSETIKNLRAFFQTATDKFPMNNTPTDHGASLVHIHPEEGFSSPKRNKI